MMPPRQIAGFIEAGMLAEAEAALAGLPARGRDPAVLTLRAMLAEKKGAADEALDLAEKAAKLLPKDASLAEMRGRLLIAGGRRHQAIAVLAAAVRANPGDAHLRFAQAIAHIGLKQFDLALPLLEQTLRLDPRHVTAKENLAGLYRAQNRFDEAIAVLRSMAPDVDDIAIGKSICDIWEFQGRHQDCIDWCRDVLARQDAPDVARSLGLALIKLGHFAEGLPFHERRATKDKDAGIGHIPYWDGRTPGRCIVVHGEQGRGDFIQFARFIHHVRPFFDRVILLARPRMEKLLATAAPFAETVSSLPEGLAADARVSVMSLPALFGLTDEAALRDRVPYMTADPDLVAAWRARIGGHGFKIGIVWRGNESAFDESRRAFPAQMFKPLADLPGVRLIALQTGEPLAELTSLKPRFAVETYPLDTGPDGFLDTAAVISLCDLVVSTDTSVAHLAGALGAPVWVALNKVSEWRWQFERADSYWYPSMRLFRQRQLDDWAPVFADMAADLSRRPQG